MDLDGLFTCGCGYWVLIYHMHAVNKALAIEGRVEFAIWIDGA